MKPPNTERPEAKDFREEYKTYAKVPEYLETAKNFYAESLKKKQFE